MENCVLAFPESKFLQLLTNLVQFHCERLTLRDNSASYDATNATIETVRTLRHLQLYQEKNSSIGKIFKERLLEQWQSVAYLTDV